MNNKILIRLYIPLIEEEYDIFIPINKRVGTIKQLLEKCISEQNDNGYVLAEDTNLIIGESDMNNLEIYTTAVNNIFACLEKLDTGLNNQENSNNISNLNEYKESAISFARLIQEDMQQNTVEGASDK